MHRFACLLAGLAGFLTALPAQTPAPSPTPSTAKIQTLIITGQNRHDWRAVSPQLRKLLEDTGRFEVRITEEFRGASDDTLARYDLVILNYENKNLPEWRWGAQAEKALVDYVKAKGKGLVIYHFSLAAFDGWAEFEQLSGGNWRPSNGHHSARHDFTLKVTDASHPITRGLPAEMIVKSDELYANLRWQPKENYRILATAYDDHALYQGKARQPIPGAGIDHPMLWVHEPGKGRVFVNALGHDLAAVANPAFIATFLRGAEWVATGAVTLVPPAN